MPVLIPGHRHLQYGRYGIARRGHSCCGSDPQIRLDLLTSMLLAHSSAATARVMFQGEKHPSLPNAKLLWQNLPILL